MKNLRVRLRLITPIAVYDDYSPSLDGLLSSLWFKRRGHYSANVTRETAEIADIPLERKQMSDEWYFACSSPHYRYRVDTTLNYHKRHDPEFTGHIDKPQKWSPSSGDFKSYDLTLFCRDPQWVTWYCTGDREGVEDLLKDCTALGKKTSQGNGFVDESPGSRIVEEVDYDYHLIGPTGQLMKPMPFDLLRQFNPALMEGARLLNYGWRPPARFTTALCCCPVRNVVKET